MASLTSLGCKQEQFDQIVKSVQDTTTSLAPATSGIVANSGSFKLQINGPIETTSANARLIVSNDGRPNVLQIRSYTDLATEEFPSVFLQANTSASDLSALVGQSLEATIYATERKYSPIWSCMDRSLASLTINSVQGNIIQCQVKCSEVFSTESQSSSLSGTIEAVAAQSDKLVSNEVKP